MRVLIVSGNSANFYTFDDVVRGLHAYGHDVRLILRDTKKETIPDDALQHVMKDIPGLIIEPIERRRLLRKFTQYLREVLNFAHILNSEETRKWDANKWLRFFPPFLQYILSMPAIRERLKNQQYQKKLRVLEQTLPIVPSVRRHIQKHSPDVLIVMPLINPDSIDVEYLRAAQQLQIPVLYSMPSWDNISTKGTFHGEPDYGIVWSESLAVDLSKNHNFSREKIFISGAPRFDHLIDHADKRFISRSEFCHAVGLDENKDYVLYVGSTFLVTNDFTVNRDETVLLLDLADAMAKDARTKDVNIMVRSHPTNQVFIERMQANPRPNVTVFPSKGEIPDTEEKRAKFHNSIFHCLAVVGVNTTAFLEASALDKPCITLHTPEFGETQQLQHFHHLVDADFLEVANGVNDVISLVSSIKNGADAHSEQRRKFVRDFLRPCGKPAVNAYVEILEDIVDLSRSTKNAKRNGPV